MGDYYYKLFDVSSIEEIMSSRDINDIFAYIGKKIFNLWQFHTEGLDDLKIERIKTETDMGTDLYIYKVIYDCDDKRTELSYAIRQEKVGGLDDESDPDEPTE